MNCPIGVRQTGRIEFESGGLSTYNRPSDNQRSGTEIRRSRIVILQFTSNLSTTKLFVSLPQRQLELIVNPFNNSILPHSIDSILLWPLRRSSPVTSTTLAVIQPSKLTLSRVKPHSLHPSDPLTSQKLDCIELLFLQVHRPVFMKLLNSVTKAPHGSAKVLISIN